MGCYLPAKPFGTCAAGAPSPNCFRAARLLQRGGHCLSPPSGMFSAHCLQVSIPAQSHRSQSDLLNSSFRPYVTGFSGLRPTAPYSSSGHFLCSCLPATGPSIPPFTLCDFLQLLLAGGYFSSCLLDVVPAMFLLEHLLVCSGFAQITLCLWYHFPTVCCRHLQLCTQPVSPSWASDPPAASLGCPVDTVTSSCPDHITFFLTPSLFMFFLSQKTWGLWTLIKVECFS